MPHKIVFSPAAEAWLEEKIEEIRNDPEWGGQTRAQALLDKINRKCQLLSEFPLITQGGRGNIPGTRHVFVDNLTMTIRVSETEVQIVAMRAQRNEDAFSPNEALIDPEDDEDAEPKDNGRMAPH